MDQDGPRKILTGTINGHKISNLLDKPNPVRHTSMSLHERFSKTRKDGLSWVELPDEFSFMKYADVLKYVTHFIPNNKASQEPGSIHERLGLPLNDGTKACIALREDTPKHIKEKLQAIAPRINWVDCLEKYRLLYANKRDGPQVTREQLDEEIDKYRAGDKRRLAEFLDAQMNADVDNDMDSEWGETTMHTAMDTTSGGASDKENDFMTEEERLDKELEEYRAKAKATKVGGGPTPSPISFSSSKSKNMNSDDLDADLEAYKKKAKVVSNGVKASAPVAAAAAAAKAVSAPVDDLLGGYDVEMDEDWDL